MTETPELQAAKERLARDRELEEDIGLLLSRLDALKAENADLLRWQAAAVSVREVKDEFVAALEVRAESAEAQRDKLAAELAAIREVDGEAIRAANEAADHAEARLSALEGACKPFLEFFTPSEET